MTLFRVQHNKNFTCINNTICTDKRLSWKAKGIWLYAFSRPDDWAFYLSDLVNQGTDGKDSVNAGLKELEKAGYLQRTRIRDEKGKLTISEWNFSETPLTDTFKPKTDFPALDNPRLDNPPLLNTDILINTKKQQHSAAVSLKIYECLECIEIPDRDKIEITERNLELDVKKAVEWATHPETKINKTLAQAIKWACLNKPEVPKNKNADLSSNKAYAKRQEAQYPNGITISCLNKCVEIACTQSCKTPQVIEYTEKGFKEQLDSALRKNNIDPR